MDDLINMKMTSISAEGKAELFHLLSHSHGGIL